VLLFVLQIMEVFKVAPYDQILFLNGEYLRENHLNLGQLGVLPGSAIFLKVAVASQFSPLSVKQSDPGFS
jgi:hypothetical protein